jgi:hypothetical protein
MLGLAQQIGGAELGIDAVVGDDHGLGRAGEEIDPDPAIELALGLGDIGIAGAHQHVDGGHALRPQRHGAHGLDSAETIDLIRPGQMLRDDGRCGRP